MNFKIEKMTLYDLNSIQNILFTEFDDFWTYSAFMQELKCENSYFIVAKNINNEVVGIAGIKIILDEADIMNIVIKKSFRQNGVGSLLVENLISYSKSLNLKTVTLEVNEHNLPAINLYNKFGFNTVGIRKKYYGGKDDAVLMNKNL